MLVTIEKVLVLKQIPLFKTVSNMALSDLMSVAEESTVKKGTDLILKDEVNQTMYFVLSGSVRCEDSVSKKVVVYTANQCLGLDTVFMKFPAGAHAWAETQVVLLKVTADKLYRMMALHPSLAMAILNELSVKIHQK